DGQTKSRAREHAPCGYRRVPSALSPGDHRPNSLVEIVEQDLGDDFGHRNRAGERGTAGNEPADGERVEAAGPSPPDGFDAAASARVAGADTRGGPAIRAQRESESPLPCPQPRPSALALTGIFDESHSDRVVGLAVDHDEAAGVSAVGVAIDGDRAIEL